MTNAMPSLQMTIKLSYGWRPLSPPVSVGRASGLTGDRKGRNYGINAGFRVPGLTGDRKGRNYVVNPGFVP